MAAKGGLTVRGPSGQQFAEPGRPRAPWPRPTRRRPAPRCPAVRQRAVTAGRSTSRQACGVLAAWDRTVNTDSRGALLFDRFWRKLPARVPAAQLWKVPFSAADPVGTPNTLNTDAPGFATALADAVTELRAAGIALDARLGDHQFVVREGQAHRRSAAAPSPWASGTRSRRVWDTAAGGYTEVSTGPVTSRRWAGTAAAARWPAPC